MRFSAMAAATVVVLVVAGAIAYFAVPQSTEVNVAQAATLAAQDPAAPDRPAAGIAAPAGSDGAECPCAAANRFASPCPGPNRDLDIR
jgi:hypothetical protein